MFTRLALLTMAGTLAMAGSASATDMQAVDTYAAITGTRPTASRPAGEELCPLSARIVALGAASAVVYYTYDEQGADAVRVVTTIGTDPAGATAPARFVSYLLPGQKAEISVAGAAGTEPASLEFAYEGGHLMVRPAVVAEPQG